MSVTAARPRVNVAVLVGGALLLVPLFVLLGVTLRRGADPRAVPSMLEDKPAQAFTLQDLDGDTWSLEALRGKPVVLNFWSTWCLPCKQEHPLLLEAARAYPDVQFLGVVFQDDADKAKAYLRMNGAAYPSLVDPNGRLAVDYGVAGVPETFFIAPDGTIARKVTGPLTPDVLMGTLDPMLRGPR